MFNIGDRVKINTEDIWEGKTGRIIDISNEKIVTSSGKDFTEIVVKVNYPTDDGVRHVIQSFPAYVLEKEEVDESLTEGLDLDFEPVESQDDYIRDYVYLTDVDDNEIPSWYFAGKIASIERIPEETVIEDARRFKYRIFRIEAPEYCKLVILAPKCRVEDIYENYANFLQGDAKITELK